MKKCASCGMELIPTKELGYFHPLSDCEEYDGYLIDPEQRKHWDKKYGTPEKSHKELSVENKKLLKINIELKTQVLKWEEKNQKRLINKLTKLMKRMTGMFSKKTS